MGRMSLAPSRVWLGQHKQRLVYLLLAIALAAVLSSGFVGGFFLYDAASTERQALRTQQLFGGVAQLQRYLLQAQAEGTTAELVAARTRELASTDAVFGAIRDHDQAEWARLHAAYIAYVVDSTSDFNIARLRGGKIPLAEERQVDRRLDRVARREPLERRQDHHELEHHRTRDHRAEEEDQPLEHVGQHG